MNVDAASSPAKRPTKQTIALLLLAAGGLSCSGSMVIGLGIGALQSQPGTTPDTYQTLQSIGIIPTLGLWIGVALLLVGGVVALATGAFRSSSGPETFAGPPLPASAVPLDIPARREILNRTLAQYSRAGWQAVAITDTTAQLVRRKTFSCLWALLWFLLFGIGLVIYLIWYWAKRDHTIFVSVDEYGRVLAR